MIVPFFGFGNSSGYFSKIWAIFIQSSGHPAQELISSSFYVRFLRKNFVEVN
jgi:hypothetical protein